MYANSINMNHLCYAGCGLDRAGHKRMDTAWLDELATRADSKITILWQGKNCFVAKREDDSPPIPKWLNGSEFNHHLWKDGAWVFLGQSESSPHFAVELETEDEEEATQLTGGSFLPLRTVGPLMSGSDAAVLAYARGMLHWQKTHRFCGRCGSPKIRHDGGHLLKCERVDCALQTFPRLDPAVIMLVENLFDPNNPKLLLGRGKGWPKNRFSTLAGFVEPGESLEEAVAREVFEEAGIQISSARYLTSQPWPFPSSLMMGFTAEAKTTEIRIDPNELEEAHWFTIDMVRDYMALRRQTGPIDSISNWLLEHWLQQAMKPT